MKYLKEWLIFEKYNSLDEYTNFVIDNLKKYNIFQSQMSDLIDRYYFEIEDAYNTGENPFQVSQKIAKDLNLETGGLFQYKMDGTNRSQAITYL
jgi:hypothetical protein